MLDAVRIGSGIALRTMMAAGELLGIPGVRVGAVDCVDRTEIVTPDTASVVPHN
jgi:hypothetical protein